MNLIPKFLRRDKFQAVAYCPVPAMEFDVENLDVVMIHRRADGETTIIFVRNPSSALNTYARFIVRCSPEKHRNLVARFRAKLGVSET